MTSSIRTERSLVAGELSHHGTPFTTTCATPLVPDSPLASHSDMKPKLRGATSQDLHHRDELRHALKDYSQDSILLMLAILHADWKALQGTIAAQRKQLRGLTNVAVSAAPPKTGSLAKRVAATAPVGRTDALDDVRRKFREAHGAYSLTAKDPA